MHDAVAERLTVLPFDANPALLVVMVGLDEPGPPAELVEWLSAAERAHAASFRFQHLTRRYFWGRACLRALLGEQLGKPPQILSLAASAEGRPYLEGVAGFDFNVSHAADLALIAIRHGPGRVGVDIEAVDPAAGVPSDHQRGLEALVCTPREQSELPAGGAPRAEAFFRLWTCKEACLKALGTGLRVDPRQFDIDITEITQPRLRASPSPHRFTIAAFRPKIGFAGALALWVPRKEKEAVLF
jgi:4'-phosphopantetheinyl transferase